MKIEEFKKEFGIIGKAKEINDLVDIAMQVAKSDISILIYGESGVGKEVFADAIHKFSDRKDKQLISVNCGAIPEGLLESELFGHKKGSFTGAIDNRKGYFEIADGGTLFLDEIAEMPLTTQVKFLRVLENKEFMKLGDEHITRVDVRIIAATNKDLQKEVESNNFREDLYFRLKAVTLTIPPLRKRKGDIELFVKYFIEQFSNNGSKQVVIENDAMNLLFNYPWPGNVRELKNTIETAIALSKTGVLEVSNFENLLNVSFTGNEKRNLPVYLHRTPEEADREIFYRALFEIKKDLIELKDLIYRQQEELLDQNHNNSNSDDEVWNLREIERKAIKAALEKTGGNRREAARLLGITERTFYRKLKGLSKDL